MTTPPSPAPAARRRCSVSWPRSPSASRCPTSTCSSTSGSSTASRRPEAPGHGAEPVELSNLYEINYDWFSSLENLRLTDEATAIEEAASSGGTAARPSSIPPPSGSAATRWRSSASPGRPGSTSSWARATTPEPTHPPALAGAAEDALVREIVRDVIDGVGRHGRPGGADRRDRVLVALDARGAEVPPRGRPRRAGDRRPAHDPPRPRPPGPRGAPRRGSPRRRSTPAGSSSPTSSARSSPTRHGSAPSSTPAATWSTTSSAWRSPTSPGAGRTCRTTPSASGRSSG